jgi:hypothetical protein
LFNGESLACCCGGGVAGGCKSSDGQTPGDGGLPDTASDHMNLPEIILKGDGGDAADGRDAPPACTGPNCPIVLATDEDPTCCIAVDGTYVYWVSFASGWWIMRVAATGGTPETIERSDSLIGDMTIRDGVLYWTASNGVFRRELASAAATTTRLVSASANNGPIATDSNAVYWAGVSGDIRKVPLAGGTSSDVVTGTEAFTSRPTARTSTGRTSTCRAVRS